MRAYEYLQTYQPGRLKKTRTRNEWQLQDHDSFKINEITSKWHWKSRNIGGMSALRFLMQVDGMGYTEAVKSLCEQMPVYVPRAEPAPKKKPFALPMPNDSFYRVRRYLNQRGIRDEVLDYCVQLGILYESAPYHNAVFVGMDEQGHARYAFLRGIYDNRGKSFRMEQEGSEKQYSFCVPPLGKSCRVAVYEAFFDLLSFGGTYPDGSERKGYSKDYIRSFSAVLQQSFRFAVSPKQYITFNPMQYIKLKYQTDEVDLFSDDDMDGDIQPIPREDYERLIEFLQDYNPPAILPIQIAYYAGLRIGEACGLAWQDVNLEEQCLTIRRSIRYDGSRHKNIIGPTKRKKVRIVDFGDTLAEILRNARKEQLKNRMQYGELYHKNYYREVKDKNRVYYEFYHLDGTENVPEDYKEISFVCLRPDGSLELPSTLGIVCRKIAQKLDGFEGFHFHQLRHTYTSNLLANGAAPKDVQELLGHSDVSTTMNVYAHSTRKAKRESAKLLDKVAGND